MRGRLPAGPRWGQRGGGTPRCEPARSPRWAGGTGRLVAAAGARHRGARVRGTASDRDRDPARSAPRGGPGARPRRARAAFAALFMSPSGAVREVTP